MAKRKNRQTEWTFSFADLGEKLSAKFNETFGRGSMIDEADIQTASFHEPRGETTSARVILDGGLGRTTVTALAASSDNLFEADLRYLGDVDFEVTGDKEKTLVLNNRHHQVRVWNVRGKQTPDLYTDVRLHPSLPLWLQVNGDIGKGELDLSGLNLMGLDLEGGIGKVDVDLPANSNNYRVQVDGGVGKTTLHIPDGATPIVDIDGGMGATHIVVPATAAVQINVDGKIGGVDVPKGYKRVRKGSDFIARSGTWQSPHVAESEEQIIIRCDGGVGKLVVTTRPEPVQV